MSRMIGEKHWCGLKGAGVFFASSAHLLFFSLAKSIRLPPLIGASLCWCCVRMYPPNTMPQNPFLIHFYISRARGAAVSDLIYQVTLHTLISSHSSHINYFFAVASRPCSGVFLRPQFFHLRPEPHGHGSLRPISPNTLPCGIERLMAGAGAACPGATPLVTSLFNPSKSSNTREASIISISLYMRVPSLRYSTKGSLWP